VSTSSREPSLHSDALFSVGRSLWGRVTPDIRGVAYELTESTLLVRVFYDNLPSEWDLENIAVAETECIADFWQTHEIRYTAVHLPSPLPRDIAPTELWVYLRHEFQFDG